MKASIQLLHNITIKASIQLLHNITIKLGDRRYTLLLTLIDLPCLPPPPGPHPRPPPTRPAWVTPTHFTRRVFSPTPPSLGQPTPWLSSPPPPLTHRARVTHPRASNSLTRSSGDCRPWAQVGGQGSGTGGGAGPGHRWGGRDHAQVGGQALGTGGGAGIRCGDSVQGRVGTLDPTSTPSLGPCRGPWTP